MLFVDFSRMPHPISQYPNAACSYWPPVTLTEPPESHCTALPASDDGTCDETRKLHAEKYATAFALP